MEELGTREILNMESGNIEIENESCLAVVDVDIQPNQESCFDASNIFIKQVSNSSFTCFSSDETFDTIEILNDDTVGESQGTTETIILEDETTSYLVPPRPKIWKCDHNCGKIFTQEKHMKDHVSVMHENVKMVQCKKCFKFLSTPARLKNHMLLHSNVKHLVCLICMRKRTDELSCMRHHLLKKHGISPKHKLFQQLFYQMSLKEISVMEKLNQNQNEPLVSKIQKEATTGLAVNQKSTKDAESLRVKIWKLSEKIQSELAGNSKTCEIQETTESNEAASNTLEDSTLYKLLTRPIKTVTAENGMKLFKMPDGQYIKATDQ